jgi:hypothetical protein
MALVYLHYNRCKGGATWIMRKLLIQNGLVIVQNRERGKKGKWLSLKSK